MKRVFPTIAAIFAAAVCFAACTPEQTGTEPPREDPDPVPQTDEYDALNEMLSLRYSAIVLTVTDTFGEGAYLKSEYAFSYAEGTKVHYRVERFAEIGEEFLPSEKVTLEGEAVVQDGFVVSVTGEEIGFPRVLGKGLTFRKEYFGNTELSGIFLKADVKDVSGFLGAEVACTDMKVEASFLEAFYGIVITYTSAAGSAVEYRFDFTV